MILDMTVRTVESRIQKGMVEDAIERLRLSSCNSHLSVLDLIPSSASVSPWETQQWTTPVGVAKSWTCTSSNNHLVKWSVHILIS